jgi:aspartyl-tRNA synthetase
VISAAHHPFTAPTTEHLAMLQRVASECAGGGASEETMRELLSLRSQAFDLVLNGVEAGGGSHTHTYTLTHTHTHTHTHSHTLTHTHTIWC